MSDLEEFEISDQEKWDSWVKNNSDSYGGGCIRYAARWASTMDKLIAAGSKLEDIVKATSHVADTEGITGFMYGCAVTMLADCWTHGEQLRKWSNLDQQLENEGELANESGDVLNPALLLCSENKEQE